jgi:hypothetical protein
MKRISTLIVLMGIVMGAVLTGCDKGDSTTAPATDAAKKAEGAAKDAGTAATNAVAPK